MANMNYINGTGRIAVVALPLAAVAMAGCSSDSAPETEVRMPATVAWSLQPQTILPIVPQDLKVTDGGIVWIADDVKDAVLRLDIPNSSFTMFGNDDAPPAEVIQPWRLAVAPDVGVVTFDGESRNIEVFTPGGRYIRGFKPDYAPSYLDITSRPISLVAAVRRTQADSTQRLFILSSDLLGQRVDTLIGPNHGPESLRMLSANPRETALAGSDTGIWIRTSAVVDTIFGISILDSGTKLVLRQEDQNGVGILLDRDLEILWVVLPDSTGLAYAGYDISAGGVVNGNDAFLGMRTTPQSFTPHVAHEGLVVGVSPDGMASLVEAYDMNVGELGRRSEP